MTRRLRWRKLVEPALQLKLVLTFTCLVVLAMGLETLLLFQELTELATADGVANSALIELLPSVLGSVVATTALVLLPLTVAAGILATFKIAGPVYRIERYLEAVLRGEDPGACTLRKGDELQLLSALVTDATALLRLRARERDESEDDTDEAEPRRAA